MGGHVPYGCDPVRLSRHCNGPIQWCSAYIPNCHFSSLVTSWPLFDDHNHRSVAGAFPLQLRLCGAWECLQSISGGRGMAILCVPLYFNQWLTYADACWCLTLLFCCQITEFLELANLLAHPMFLKRDFFRV